MSKVLSSETFTTLKKSYSSHTTNLKTSSPSFVCVILNHILINNETTTVPNIKYQFKYQPHSHNT